MASTKHVIEDMLNGYIIAALWTSTDENDEPMDKSYGRRDIAPSSVKSMRKDIVRFVRANKNALYDYGEHRVYNRNDGNVWEHAGHDLWLTRNGHGAGYWDRDYGGHDEIGEKLSAGAKKLGSSDMYHGDDGMLYVSPER